MAGPHVLFSLNPSAGPTRQLHTPLRLPREPSPPRRRCSSPVRRRSAAARAQLHRASTVALLCHRPRAATPRLHRRPALPPPARCNAAPAPCGRHLCAADHAPPPSKSSAAACRASTPSPRAVHLHPPLNLLTRREPSSPCPSHLVLICTQGARQFVSKTTCVDFVGFSSFDLSGYDLNLLDMCCVSVSPQLHTCSHISLIVHKSHSCSNTSRSLLVCSFRGYPLEFMF